MRNQRRPEKICLSPELETLLFGRTLKKREIEALRERCESYQSGAPRPWTGDIYPPYAQYFGLLSALKIKTVMAELEMQGYLDIWKTPPQIYDFGAGTLGATLGAVDFLKSRGKKPQSLYAFDQEKKPVDWAKNEFSDFLPKPVQWGKPATLENTLILAVDVFNEMGLAGDKDKIDTTAEWFREIQSWVEQATPTTVIIIIEPASKFINRNFLTLRNLLSEKISILLPCTHQKACPALLSDEWCHEEQMYKAPSVYWNLVRLLGFRRNMLQFSMLSLGKQPSQFTANQARVVSRPLKSKGRCDKWLCADGKRWKGSLLTRHKKDEKLAEFYEAARGDIVDCHSTGLIPPD